MPQTIKAFGRAFDASDSGKLLDVNGGETRFDVMEIEIKMAAVPHDAYFPDMRPGDSVGFYEPLQRDTMGGVMDTHVYNLLIRDGRLVTYRTPHEGIMYD